MAQHFTPSINLQNKRYTTYSTGGCCQTLTITYIIFHVYFFNRVMMKNNLFLIVTCFDHNMMTNRTNHNPKLSTGSSGEKSCYMITV